MLEAIHLVIGIACLVAGFRVVPSFQALIRLHPFTVITGVSFFVLTGVGQFGLASHHSGEWLFALVSYLQAISIVGFLISLARDVQKALRRLRFAFMAIRNHYQSDGERVIATITTALQGQERDRVRN